MRLLSPKDLGKWEPEYHALIEEARLPLTPRGTWFLADKPAIVAVFDQDEVVYITATRTLAKTMQSFHKEGAVNEFRSYVAIFECGLSPKTAEKRAASGRAAQRVDSAVAKLSFAAIPAPPAVLDQIAKAFIAVADPRYNGATATSNLAIDALPQ